MLALGEDGLREHIRTIGLYSTKAKNVVALSQLLVEEHGGEVPRQREALETLPGVGRKTANVVLNVAFGSPTIAVDTHIFRVANRTGLAPGKTPLEVEDEAEARVPAEYLRHAHHWLILHGRYICKARRPECWRCPIAESAATSRRAWPDGEAVRKLPRLPVRTSGREVRIGGPAISPWTASMPRRQARAGRRPWRRRRNRGEAEMAGAVDQGAQAEPVLRRPATGLDEAGVDPARRSKGRAARRRAALALAEAAEHERDAERLGQRVEAAAGRRKSQSVLRNLDDKPRFDPWSGAEMGGEGREQARRAEGR